VILGHSRYAIASMDNGQSQAKRRINLMSLLLAALDIYAVGLTLLLVLRFLPYRFPFVEFAANLLGWALLPGLLIMIVFLLLRQWRRAVMWVLPAIAFILLFGELFLPNVSRARACSAESCIHLRVMTYNVFGEHDANRDEQVKMLRDSGADVIALQELREDASNVFDKALADLYPYRFLYPDSIFGAGLLSKYPIQSPETFQIPPGVLYQLRAVVMVKGIPITLYSVHPSPPVFQNMRYTTRSQQELVSVLKQASGHDATLLLGDFNMSDQSADYHLITDAGFHDAWREAGWGFGATWPNRINNWNLEPFPRLIRIDYVWYTSDFEATQVQVGGFSVSDHSPVIADLIFAP
jgi:vancomycin resistance protein VanJ